MVVRPYAQHFPATTNRQEYWRVCTQSPCIVSFRVGSVEKRGISGGQRKRVNIGLELVGSPSVLFLDEVG